MQDVHHIGAGAGGTAGGGGGGQLFGGEDRRLRPHNHHQELKCPRCDSLNTKFCYYNNYNLSQPRHFCKNCRRYWTKGGVLRNVPVGGGCRKAKRSKQKSSASSSGDGAAGERSSGVQSPSSESSSLTAATTATTLSSAVAPVSVEEEGSALTTAAATYYSFADARFFDGNPNFDDQPIVNQATDDQIFPADSFTSLITSSTEMIGFDLPGIQTAPQKNRVPASENLDPVIVDQTAEEIKMQELNDEGLVAALDWGGGGSGGLDQGLFDLTAAVVPAYWTQPQWTDTENPSVNFLP